MFEEGLVSFAITHFFDSIKVEKLLQNFKTSLSVKSLPKIPLIPEMDIFNESKPKRLFINSDRNGCVPR